MTGLGQGSAIAAYQEQANRMRRSHDEDGSLQMNMYSLGVMDLDLSISPDVFGLRAFDTENVFIYIIRGHLPQTGSETNYPSHTPALVSIPY